MKNNTQKHFLIALAFSAAIISGFNAHAQYPAASVLLSTNTILENYSINSTADYMRLEQGITTLAAKLKDAHQKYPNLKYIPMDNNGDVVAFIITGVDKTSAANEISSCLMQLEILGKVARTVDFAYLPSAKGSKLSRISKKEASR